MVAKLRGNDHVFTREHCSTCVVTRQHLLEFQIIHESFSFPLFSKGAAVLDHEQPHSKQPDLVSIRIQKFFLKIIEISRL